MDDQLKSEYLISYAIIITLGGLSNNIFASKYVTYMPDKEQFIAQVEAVLSSNNNTE